MNKRLLTVALTAMSACAISAGAFAQSPANSQNAELSSTATAGQAVAATKKADARRAVPSVDSHLCLRETGSHIRPPKGQCLPVAGRSYSGQDLMNTGAVNVGRALQMLDPSISGGGH